MSCRRAQEEFSTPEAARHFSTCDECAEFRETTLAIENRYRMQVRAGIDRLRRREPVSAPRPRLSRVLLPLAAMLLACWCGLSSGRSAPPSPPVSLAAAPDAGVPAARSLLYEDAALFGDRGLELSFLTIGDPRLPVRMDDELHLPEPEISLPRDLRF